MRNIEAKKEEPVSVQAASAITIDIDIGHLFKKFYRGFDAGILTWLPYNEDENDELTFPFKF